MSILLFPRNPCTLARENNPFRCPDASERSFDRCGICRLAAQNEVWRALVDGEKHLAEFILADHLLTQHGFVVSRSANPPESFNLVLLRSKAFSFSSPGDWIVEPRKPSGYRISLMCADGISRGAYCETLLHAWLQFRPREELYS